MTANPWRRERSFASLWLARGSTAAGDAIGDLALPLAALALVEASPFEVAVLIAAESVFWPLVGPFAGALVDRWNRRTVLVVTYFGRGCLTTIIGLLIWADAVTFAHLLVIAGIIGLLGIFEGVAEAAILPSIVAEDDLVAANGTLSSTETAADSSVTGVIGFVIERTSLAVAFVLDAALAFVATFAALRLPSTRPEGDPDALSVSAFRSEVREGFAFAVSPGLFRTTALVGIAWNLAVAFQFSAIFVFLTGPGEVGPIGVSLVFVGASVGGIIAAARTDVLTRRFGTGPVWRAALLCGVVGSLLMSASGAGFAIASFVVGFAILTAGGSFNAVLGSALRQQLCPDRLLGRVAAATRVLTWSLIPLFVVLGGLVADAAGSRTTLIISTAMFALAYLVMKASSLGAVRDLETVR